MKFLFVNGSPRLNGNTRTALCAIEEGVRKGVPDTETEFIDVENTKLNWCMDCRACKTNGGVCISDDETNELMSKLEAADVVLFGTPVYWWGISAQLKTFIDKLYCCYGRMTGKKAGVFAVGSDELEGTQYRLIREQFECIFDYIGWDFAMYETASATDAGEIADQPELMSRLAEAYKLFT